MSAPSSRESDGNLAYTVGLIGGGLVLGYGIMMLPWSFGWAEGECLNCDFRGIGFTALDNLTTLPASDYSIGMIVAGFLLMVALNAGAWRRTGGY